MTKGARCVVLLFLAGGCFRPSYPVGLACSDAGTCPPDQVCRASVCRLPDDLGPPDAGSFDAGRDAPIDAAPDAALSAAGLGVPCGAVLLCPASTPICRSTDGVAQDGFCTLDCAGPTGPDDAPCGEGYAQASGVPACLFQDVLDPSRWFCGLRCGTGSTPSDDGPCPHDLRCAYDQDGDGTHELCVE